MQLCIILSRTTLGTVLHVPRRKPTGPRDRRDAVRTKAERGPTSASQEAFRARQKVVCASKDRYASEAEARAFAIMHQPGAGRRAAAYRCDVCGGWHPTSGR